MKTTKKVAKTPVVSSVAVSPVVASPVVVAPALTVAMLNNALAVANESYKKKHGSRANLNKSGYNPDFAKAQKIVSSISESQLAEFVKLEVSEKLVSSLNDASNTKKPMRILQALLFTVTGSGSFLKGSAKTFLLEFCGLVIAGAKNRAGLAFCATGQGSGHTSDEVYSTAKARQLMKMFGQVKVNTEKTQNSVSFSKGGIADTLGVAKKDSRTGLPVVNLENAVAVRLNSLIEKLSDNSIALIVAQASLRDIN